MNEAKQKLSEKIASMTTDQLKETSIIMATALTNEEIIVGTYAERELEKRLTEREFIAHIECVENIMDRAL